MAVALTRVGLARVGIKKLFGKTGNVAILERLTPVTQTQVAHLRATFGEKYPYKQPFPYETKSYNHITEWFDGTAHRLNENSKIIVVEGNVAVGKHEFAKRLARMFDMAFMPTATDDLTFINEDNGFDMRQLNQFLPADARFYDVEDFLTNPIARVGWLEIQWYRERIGAYLKAMQHVLSTGQGVVLAGSAFGHTGYVEAMRRKGYVSKQFMKFFNTVRDDTLVEMLRPHVMIYLDTPIDVVRERLQKRNNPVELKSKVLTDDFLTEIDRSYKEVCIPSVRRTTEILEVDWSTILDDLDMEALAEEMTRLTLESTDREDPKFGDWCGVSEDQYALYRKRAGSEQYLHNLFPHQVPTNCSEILLNDVDWIKIRSILNEHPALKYEQGWAPEFGYSTMFKL